MTLRSFAFRKNAVLLLSVSFHGYLKLFHFNPECNGADSCCLVFCFDEDSLVG